MVFVPLLGQLLLASAIGQMTLVTLPFGIRLRIEATTIAVTDPIHSSLIPTDKMLADPDLAPLVHDQEVNVWLGPGRHIVAYNIVSTFGPA